MPNGERPVPVQIRTRHGGIDQESGATGACDEVFRILDLAKDMDQDHHYCTNLSDFSQCRSRSASPKGHRVSVCSCPSPEKEASPCDRHHHRRNSIAVKFGKSSD